jgi:hypothetical protein
VTCLGCFGVRKQHSQIPTLVGFSPGAPGDGGTIGSCPRGTLCRALMRVGPFTFCAGWVWGQVRLVPCQSRVTSVMLWRAKGFGQGLEVDVPSASPM